MPQFSNAKKFNNSSLVIEGWYWALASKQLKKGKVKALTLLGRELALFRGKNGQISALDAYCPHMGAHLAEGKVEDNNLRCFFHNWCFDANGQCIDIPCLNQKPTKNIGVMSWPVEERYGLIWIWTGQQAPHPVPDVPDLEDQEIVYASSKRFLKKCHPNVVMINAIDEQHFHTVHKLPGSILQMHAEEINSYNLNFTNQGKIPTHNKLGSFICQFYQHGILRYSLSYWYGTLGTVTLGPDFLRLYILFALRLTEHGAAEGQMIAITRKRVGVFGKLITPLILTLTKLAGRYFAIGDTRIFQSIRFNLKTPIIADRSIISFINHFEQQKVAVAWMQQPYQMKSLPKNQITTHHFEKETL